jgi:hypothetical protein
MRAYLLIMLCISLFELRGQRIAKIVITTGSGVHIQEGAGPIHYVFDDLIAGYAKSEDNTQIFTGFLTPFFSSLPTRVHEDFKTGIQVFPNPFTHQIRVRAKSAMGPVSYLLFDTKGRLLMSGKGLLNEIEINGQSLVAGIYLLRFHHPDGHFEIHKLIKL